ncbi:alpha-1,2-fucosyltransferase [Chryseobacterium aquaticum]|uniref:Alpha-1,2-fucosyltransferase n=1 Tax=Chryseobacterium aquaticum TaxID=452084 RepID=A0A848MYR5_9FLAO|nr:MULTISPECIES: alpha-1,2-fucosyltransferase [Chryseobacterium]NMR33817.1 alpha-1,2-fucosyltransferase [Chryseobacterium aquaticum]NRQ45893.1 alpha-1,2-fucosyltransferase [Chryseobacterium sp. C-204]
MVAVELIGGLGNQMFQYATAKALSLHRDERLLLDSRLFDNYKLHSYALNHFNINASVVKNHLPLKAPSFQKKVRDKLLQKVNLLALKNKIFSTYQEKNLLFDDSLFRVNKKNIYLKGYFQTEKYFLRFEDEIRKDFEIISPLKRETLDMLKIIEAENSISLHIRRGDYISNPNANAVHGTCNLDYYYNAIEIIKEKTKDPVFFIFSDDIYWAKENLKIENTMYFVDFNDASTNYEDIKLMSACKHNIIANSSFSWWGAWLNRNKNKTVIAPSKWFNTDMLNSKDIIPESWMKI